MIDSKGFRGYVLPEDVWDLFEKNERRLSQEIVVISENVETGYTMCATIDKGIRVLRVYRNDDIEIEEPVVCEADCTDVACSLTDCYLLPFDEYSDSIETGKSAAQWESERGDDVEEFLEQYSTKTHEETRQEQEDLSYEREDELSMALDDFLQVVIPREMDGLQDLLDEKDKEEILDTFLEYLSHEFGIPIFRPLFLPGKDGEEVFVRYPYEDNHNDGNR